MGDYMSDGAIAGLVLGIICFVVCIVLLMLWLLRCQNCWASRKHTKMPSPPANEARFGTNNRFYCSETSDGPGSSESWTNGSFGLPKVNWHSAASSSPTGVPQSPVTLVRQSQQAQPIDFQSIGPFRTTWVDRVEPSMSSNTAPHLFSAPSAISYARETESVQQTPWVGPTSIYFTNSSGGLYPNLQKVSDDSPKGCPNYGKPSGRGATLKRKLRSNVQKVARASQSEVFRFNRRRSSLIDNLKRSKHSKKSSRKSKSMHGSGMDTADGEGYYNMNASSDRFGFDEMGSLDNDEFLCSLERAVFPGIVDTRFPLSTSSQPEQSFWPLRQKKRTSFSFLSSAYPGSNYRNLASGDLSLGALPGSFWNPVQQDTRMYPSVHLPTVAESFRFPAPGPPVAGWAHQLTRSEHGPDTEPTSPIIQHNVTGDTGPSAHRGRLPDSYSESTTHSTAVPRPRAGKKVKGRQSSELKKDSQVNPQPTASPPLTKQKRFNSVSTLASILDPCLIQTSPNTLLTSENPMDSGFHDSTVDNSLEMSTHGSISPHPPILHQTENYLLSKAGIRMYHTRTDEYCHHRRPSPEFSNRLERQYNHTLADITTSQSSNATSHDSADSTTVMLSQHAKHRSTSVSRRRPSSPTTSVQHFRSPSYPDFSSSQQHTETTSQPWHTRLGSTTQDNTDPHLTSDSPT